jgi:hypothetical protein
MSLAVSLSESDAKIILEALTSREREMTEICAMSDDEDLVAETGNDLIELRLLLKTLRTQAVRAFGEGVLNFSREPL